jgi:predicted outer membrane lipoprotein
MLKLLEMDWTILEYIISNNFSNLIGPFWSTSFPITSAIWLDNFGVLHSIRMLKLLEITYSKIVQWECWSYWKWRTPKWSNQNAEAIGNDVFILEYVISNSFSILIGPFWSTLFPIISAFWLDHFGVRYFQ